MTELTVEPAIALLAAFDNLRERANLYPKLVGKVVRSGLDNNVDCTEMVNSFECDDCTGCHDSLNVTSSESCTGCGDISYSNNCIDCFRSTNLTGCISCEDCKNCLLCVGLKSRIGGYWLLNRKVSKAAYEAAIAALDTGL